MDLLREMEKARILVLCSRYMPKLVKIMKAEHNKRDSSSFQSIKKNSVLGIRRVFNMEKDNWRKQGTLETTKGRWFNGDIQPELKYFIQIDPYVT